VHANKVSFVFSGKQILQSTSSPVSISNQSHLVNPSDGRRYKKAIVEGHLSNLTFSPSLNQRTVELDQ